MGRGEFLPAVHGELSVRAVCNGRRTLAALAISIAVLTAFAGCGYPVASSSACADAVLDDWTRGALDSVYPADCYQDAIEALPEDLRAYTTAADDISRAGDAASRTDVSARQLAASPVANDDLRAFPSQVVLIAVFAAALAVGGVAASLIRRRRTRER
jgi:hypothetical protein